MSLPVKVKKLSPNAVIPTQGTEQSAGMDLTSTSEKVVMEGSISYVEYGTGLSLEIPKGFMGLIFPRSSISSNTTLMLNNSIGVIDSDYRGEVKLRFKNTTVTAGRKYKVGDKIGQLVILPYPKVSFLEVEDINETERGAGGFGSTGA